MAEHPPRTADRSEFIGRNCTTSNPAALNGAVPLSGRIGGGLDPCAVLQTEINLAAGNRRRSSSSSAKPSTMRRAAPPSPKRANSILTPNCSRDRLLGTHRRRPASQNARSSARPVAQWMADISDSGLPSLGRSAFYQASGAYGFRDQLQDVMSFTATRPELTRAQILRAAARQFVEGDVQHWWFEPSGRGVRTRISDDLLWLAFVTAHYIETTGDGAIRTSRSASSTVLR